MRRPTFDDSTIALSFVAPAISRQLVLDHGRSRFYERLVECFALGLGAAIAHRNRLGSRKELDADIADVTQLIGKAVRSSRRFDERNNETLFSAVFDRPVQRMPRRRGVPAGNSANDRVNPGSVNLPG